ncbi:hypothetical protein ERO13_D11G308225v2, partial [Gossypium hirsutum]
FSLIPNLRCHFVGRNFLAFDVYLCFGQLESLETLDFGYNLLEGVVLETHFSNLTRLTTLKASHNRLRFEPNSSWILPFQCQIIELGHWHLGPKFPHWLKFQKNLSVLDISDAGISDFIPPWFWHLPTQFKYLNISFNQLIGGISYLNNLEFLNLGGNNLIGKIPPLGHSKLFMLILQNNSMHGELPSTLQNATWIGDKFSFLNILNLQSNNFDGRIPHKICDLLNILILDLAHNNISGTIPKCFGVHLTARLVLKGRKDEYSSILGFVTNMDLSTNTLTAEIPKEIGRLVELQSLNLSWNLLIGNIPYNIGNMELIESLDLSMN